MPTPSSTTTRETSRADRCVMLDRARAARRARRAAEVEELEAALDWAHAHAVISVEEAATWSDPDAVGPASLWGEHLVPIAGEGAPLVAEFAPVELAGVLDLSHEAALALMGDALDLAHRLPRTWALVRSQRIPVRLGRLAAGESRDLSDEAADHADRLLAWQPRRLNPHRVGVLVHEARLHADPDRAAADHDAALAERRADVRHDLGAPGTSRVSMILDTADASALDDSLGAMAAQLAALGDGDDLNVRRARAVGILASPQRALDLMGCDPAAPDADTSEAVSLADDAALEPSSPFRRGFDSSGRQAVLVLHLSDVDLLSCGLLGKGGVARSTKLGPVLMDRLSGWLIGAEVMVKPVLDPRLLTPLDRHDPSDAIAEAVRLRDETCVFPGCRRPAEACDLDHIEPYVPLELGGPPGQTCVDALACVCRRHHRAKTFGGFSYRRLADGSYEWTTPTGQVITTDPPRRRPTPPR